MLFNSIDFLIFFPIVTILYFAIPHKYRWFFLLVASCIFYMAFIPIYILFLFALILIDYSAAIFIEKSDMDKSERIHLLEEFKKYKDVGAVLLAVISGSFSEGIDLPGDFLKCVVVVGLPLSQPDLETKSLIDYYDKKFGKGWEYGYLIPAFNKSLQSAGRCIRSEKDKGVIVFMDKRYLWQNYYKYFPLDWNIKTAKADYVKIVDEFFRNNFSH